MAKKPTYEELEQRVKELENGTFGRKQAEKQSQLDHSRLMGILELIPDGVYIVDQHFNIEYINPVIERDFGKVQGRKCYQYLQNRTASCPWCKNEKVFAGRSIRWEWYSVKNDRHYDLFDTPFENFDGTISKLQIFHDITERKRAEELLRESEKEYSSTLNDLLVGVVVHASDTSIQLSNPEATNILGLTYEQMSGKKTIDPAWKFLHEDSTVMKVEDYPVSIVFSTRKPIHGYVVGINRPDRDYVTWAISNAIPVFSNNNELEKVVVNFVDITSRKQAEEALRESEAQKKAILDASIDVIRLVDKDMKIIWSNKTTATELKVAPEQLVGKFCYEAVAGRDTPCSGCPTKKALKSGKIEHTLMHQKELKGIKEETYWDDYAVPVKNESDDIVNIIQISRNITNSKLAEEALRESEKKYRTVLDSNPDPVVVYDMEGKVTYLNPAFTRVFGWSLDEQIGKKIDNFVPEENWPETRMMINKVTALGESFSGLETRRHTKEGNILDISISGSCYCDQEGNIAASVINLRDITAQKRLEDQLRQATKMEAIATLAGGVAHEFNNALMGVMGNIELLKIDLPEDERRDRSFEAMKDSGHRMSRLTDQLLAYARGGKYQAKDLKLDDFTIGTLPILQHALNPEVRVETRFQKDTSYIRADHAQMQMVMSAIVANSNEAIKDEGLISITAGNKDLDEDFTKQHPGLKPGSYVCVTIEDNGKGMDEEEKEKIFEPFFTTKFQGRGMGMAAVYGIIKSHDGAITVDSEPGKGTVVRIYLPAVEAKEEAKAVKQPKTEIAKGEGTILVIEDEESLVYMFRQILEKLGYRVLVAETGKEAVALAKTFDGQIDLALLDIKLPDMDGGRVYPLIMEARPGLKVIVCSGYSIHGPAQDILDAGAEGFIQKPFSIAPFAEKLKEVLEGK